MRYKVSGIVYAPGVSSIKNLPSDLVTADIICDPAHVDVCVYEYVAAFTGWAVDGAREIVRYQSPQDFARLIYTATEHGTLKLDNRGAAQLMAAIGVAARDGQPNALYSQIERLLTGGRPQQVELYPDGNINELSFGVLWYNATPKWEGSDYVERTDGHDAKPFMQGGLIYRGPERCGAGMMTQRGEGVHTWSVHT